MRFFGVNSVALLGALASVSSTAYAQSCQAPGSQCGDTSTLMVCESGSWSAQQCGASSTCMTMGGMIHCMLNPDAAVESTSTEMATSTESSMESMTMTMETTSTSEKTTTTSGAKGISREAGAFIAVGAMIAGMIALF
ncbi:hypothetical protein LPJ59_002310 [Coemansia sp. RSA 2399]|nr:hypothetical protein LPJ59_002310 [Coemansia sp. RSA 2399]KAJ1905354.1 hypothetical protein LPJ81_001969 [Coemansia sp. IMI 209127]